VQQNPNTFLNAPAIHSSARMAPAITEGSDGASGDGHGKVVNLNNSSAEAAPEVASRVADDSPYGDDEVTNDPPYGDDPTDGSGDNWNVGPDDPENLGDDLPTSSDDGSDNLPVETSGPGGTDPGEGTTSSTLDESPEPPVGLPDDGYTSGAEFQKIADLKAQADAAQNAAIADPNNAQLAQAAQDALEQYQLEVARARQESAMMAQQEMDALKAAKLN
jgi:hypothetical protein